MTYIFNVLVMNKNCILLVLSLIIFLCVSSAEAESNLHIYLCIGQSNMEGYGDIEPIDTCNVSERFKTMAAVDFPSINRTKYNWYTALPPVVREDTHLSVVDWFGRTMVSNLPDSIDVGVICVAVGSSKIEYLDRDFDENILNGLSDWIKKILSKYDNKPYDVIIDCAKKAMAQGEIKGILLHQGEANYTDAQWPQKVKKLYTDMLNDLGLSAENVPLLMGEAVTIANFGKYGLVNGMMADIPDLIPTAHIVSSKGLKHKGDNAHFSSESYRILGCRYAKTMLDILGYKNLKFRI